MSARPDGASIDINGQRQNTYVRSNVSKTPITPPCPWSRELIPGRGSDPSAFADMHCRSTASTQSCSSHVHAEKSVKIMDRVMAPSSFSSTCQTLSTPSFITDFAPTIAALARCKVPSCRLSTTRAGYTSGPCWSVRLFYKFYALGFTEKTE